MILLCCVSVFAADAKKSDVYKKVKKTLSVFEDEWYGKCFKRLEEPSLTTFDSKKSNVYRFTVLPTWGNAVSVRLTIKDESVEIEARRLDGQAGYEPGKLVEKKSAALSTEDIKEFKKLFDKLKFYDMETEDKNRGFDGSEWIIEALQDGKYHYVTRWSPAYDTKRRGTTDFVDVCKWIYKKCPLKSDLTNKGNVIIEK